MNGVGVWVVVLTCGWGRVKRWCVGDSVWLYVDGDCVWEVVVLSVDGVWIVVVC